MLGFDHKKMLDAMFRIKNFFGAGLACNLPTSCDLPVSTIR